MPAALPDPYEDAGWRERSGRLFSELQRPAQAMVRRAFRGAFSDEEIGDIYAGAWVGVLRALASRHEQLSDEEVRSYVFTAVAHQAGKELRRRRRKPTAPLDLVGGVPDAADGPDELFAGAERSRVARDLLTTLPPRRRAVMLLRYGWGLEPRQVCELIKGLSPRAYRKEITRGVDELTEKMRRFERGAWCSDREPVLKAYAAGLADEDQCRQAQAHLSHCRECAGFVARLAGHLHDLGSGAVVPLALSGLGRPSLADRLAAVADSARDGVTGLVNRAPVADEVAAPTAASGGAKGAAAAGAGLLGKLAGIGVGGKLAVACIGGGVAATACVAAGVGPLFSASTQVERTASAPHPSAESKKGDELVAVPVPATPPSVAETEVVDQGPATAEAQARTTPDDPPPAAAPAEPVAPEAPPAEQEFGVASAATASATEAAPAGQDSSSGGDASASAARQEFAP